MCEPVHAVTNFFVEGWMPTARLDPPRSGSQRPRRPRLANHGPDGRAAAERYQSCLNAAPAS